MTDRDPVYDAMKAVAKDKFNADRARFMRDAEQRDDGLWNKHTDHHWSRYVWGDRLDYWPSRKKFQFRGVVRRGDVYAFIEGLGAPGDLDPLAGTGRHVADSFCTTARIGAYWAMCVRSTDKAVVEQVRQAAEAAGVPSRCYRVGEREELYGEVVHLRALLARAGEFLGSTASTPECVALREEIAREMT